MRAADPGGREPVEGRRLEMGLAIAAQVAPGQVVALDKDDAGAEGGGRGIRENGGQIGAGGDGPFQRQSQKNQETRGFHLELGLCERKSVQGNSFLPQFRAENRSPV